MSSLSTKEVLESASQYLEKRKERRYPTNDPVRVTVTPGSAAIDATLVDVSRSGMRLELLTPLQRGGRIEVRMPGSKVAIFGEVRYCRRSGAVFHAGLLIKDVVEPKPDASHLSDDEIAFYVVGKGLAASEVLHAETHIFRCDACKRRMIGLTETLYPRQKR